MKTLGNVLWFILGGVFMAIGWFVAGCFWCITIIGIPVGVQSFKMAGLSLFPFGKTVTYSNKTSSVIFNILWLIFGGLEIAVSHFVIGCIFCITIIGIPFGKQHFKLGKLALMPFGATVN
ncbi:MAG: YccF domain-containing protein [Dehalococcoidia bacterium]|nr:YccF domain-containing protein [Dehalococcoidia bacterium]